MSRFLLMITITFSLTACALTAPKPPACVDDGRGMIPLNPEKLSEDDINAARGLNNRMNVSDINQPRG